MLAAGSLDRRITLENYQEVSRDALNEPVSEWVPLAVVWAGLVEMTGAERIAAGQTVASKTRVFNIRHRADVVPGKDRAISYQGSRYDIVSVSPIEGREVGLRITTIARAE